MIKILIIQLIYHVNGYNAFSIIIYISFNTWISLSFVGFSSVKNQSYASTVAGFVLVNLISLLAVNTFEVGFDNFRIVFSDKLFKTESLKLYFYINKRVMNKKPG